jgi:hypothetical protein
MHAVQHLVPADAHACCAHTTLPAPAPQARLAEVQRLQQAYKEAQQAAGTWRHLLQEPGQPAGHKLGVLVDVQGAAQMTEVLRQMRSQV